MNQPPDTALRRLRVLLGRFVAADRRGASDDELESVAQQITPLIEGEGGTARTTRLALLAALETDPRRFQIVISQCMEKVDWPELESAIREWSEAQPRLRREGHIRRMLGGRYPSVAAEGAAFDASGAAWGGGLR